MLLERIKILVYYTDKSSFEGKAVFTEIVSSLANNDADPRENIFENTLFLVKLLRFDEENEDKADLIYYPREIMNNDDYYKRYENMLALSRSKRDSIIPY